MFKRAWMVGGATIALAFGSAAMADEPTLIQSDPASVQFLAGDLPAIAPGTPDSFNTNRAPLMGLLDQAGAARVLDQARINIYGHIEGSFTYNTDNPALHLNLGRVFDINDLRGQINQIDLHIERKADLHQWDIGGSIELYYGTDARFTTSSDFLGNSSSSNSSSSSSPGSIFQGAEYQLDIPQLYLDVTAPIGNGLRLRVGKFLFFKQIDPNASVFFSHSFTFGAALPFTLTGLTAYYQIFDELSLEVGISRGWGQTFTDNNGAIDALGRVRYAIQKGTDLSIAMIIGPELNHDNSHYRTTIDATLTQEITEKWKLLFDGVFGAQAQPSGTADDYWYGISIYSVFKCCDEANFNLRGEVYRDEEGFTTGVAQTMFEVTAGFTIMPFPKDAIGSNLKIRPEVRWDYSTRAYFNGLQDHSQITFAIDAFFDY